MSKINLHNSFVRTGLVRASRAHFMLLLVIVVQIMAYDAAKLITPQAVVWRWIATATLFVIVTLVWAVARTKPKNTTTYHGLTYLLILADIAFASFSIYTQRGMASRAVALYLIPIVLAGILTSRTAIFGTAAVSIAAYTTTAVIYFRVFFNEGYKIELYGEIGFYSAMFLVVASLVWVLVRVKKK